MADARAAKLTRAATAVAEPPDAPEPEIEEPGAESDNVMAQLAGLFSQAAGQKADRDQAINQAMDILGRLDPRKYPDIADNPSVIDFVDRVQTARAQQQGARPGSYIGNPNSIAGKKVPWTWNDLNKSIDWTPEQVAEANARGEIAFPWVEYRPMHTRTIIWNGLRVFFKARQLVKVCKVFVDTYENALNEEEFAEQHAAWLFNVPGVQAHRDFFTTNGPRVKAMDESKGEYFSSGGGMISMAPSQGEDTGVEEG